MKKILGITGIFLAIVIATSILSPNFLTAYNIENLLRRTSLFGILSIGVGFVILTAGIDLSIGGVVCLAGILTPYLLTQMGWSAPEAVAVILLMSLAIGIVQGGLVAFGRIQPFLVTLCGLLIFRGIARGVTMDQTQGFQGKFAELRWIGNGRIPIPGVEEFTLPAPVLSLIVIAILSMIFLNCTVWGRWMKAVGRSPSAARYSGIPVAKLQILAYSICSLLSGFGGLLFVCDVGSAQPSDFGNFYELYAIAAAVLGGYRLSGGEGSVLGVIIGAAVMQVLRNAIVLVSWLPHTAEFAVIGIVILIGVLADEFLRRYASNRARTQMKGT
ncbi:MAG: ABC transporter permease [Planctomycetota bacterium]|nr:ABC transporter permease [Planctomycetota bacterium]MDA1262425.1 ABC transporter permease [Planctomycetota bacterium]